MSPPASITPSAPEQPVESVGSGLGVGPGLQIDPRLTAAAVAADAQPDGVPSKDEVTQPRAQPVDAIPMSASQAPTINALVHNIQTQVPLGDKASESDADRQGSTSPGGTKNGAPPQDIPSEKLGFREDKRALSKLDRVFAKV